MYSHVKTLAFGLLLFVAGCAGSGPASQSQPSKTEAPNTDTDSLLTYQHYIEPDYLRQHLTIFAHDSMQGRETGTEGLEKAADYLAEQYRKMGLQPAGDDNSYFQKFKLNATKSDSVIFETISHHQDKPKRIDKSVASKTTGGNYIRAFGGTDTLSGKIVYAGFGINDAAHDVSHLGGQDLKGKWVMVFQDIPHIVDGDTLVSPSVNSRTRFRTIFSRGAEGILLIPDMTPDEFKASAKEARYGFGEPGNMRLAYLDDGTDTSRGFSRGYNLINPQFAATLLGMDSIESVQKQLLDDIKNFESRELYYSLKQTPYATDISFDTKNVAAFYEGADPLLRDEVIVMTSHYDHLGIGEPDSTGDRIYNGADDDGSGTIGLLNVAKAFVEAGKYGLKPKRSILFLHVSGEEKGLLGSHYYSDHPLFAMDKTVANLNTDMIGRVDEKHQNEGVEDYSYIIGSELISSDLDSLIKVANNRSGKLQLDKRYNDLKDPNRFYRRSDHWHFGRKKVPFAFFFSGVHEDYHKPSDEVHKIRFEKMARIVRTMYSSAVIIANTDTPPDVDNEAFIEVTKSNN
jgi:hypothetical protein